MTVHLELDGGDYGLRLVKFGLSQRGEYITGIEMMSRKIQDAILFSAEDIIAVNSAKVP
ncbi:hypothetical protein DPMN_046135 [Dreissena polymorpha]|uniref:Uncharacterized protein n=1 Tax=Dreissena polymorpha TaxID=45954 RepID=A0A9D4D5M7_DREPO|nr:hypothetical protein DPMN_046135 [Dreissena polymorpha]